MISLRINVFILGLFAVLALSCTSDKKSASPDTWKGPGVLIKDDNGDLSLFNNKSSANWNDTIEFTDRSDIGKKYNFNTVTMLDVITQCRSLMAAGEAQNSYSINETDGVIIRLLDLLPLDVINQRSTECSFSFSFKNKVGSTRTVKANGVKILLNNIQSELSGIEKLSGIVNINQFANNYSQFFDPSIRKKVFCGEYVDLDLADLSMAKSQIGRHFIKSYPIQSCRFAIRTLNKVELSEIAKVNFNIDPLSISEEWDFNKLQQFSGDQETFYKLSIKVQPEQEAALLIHRRTVPYYLEILNDSNIGPCVVEQLSGVAVVEERPAGYVAHAGDTVKAIVKSSNKLVIEVKTTGVKSGSHGVRIHLSEPFIKIIRIGNPDILQDGVWSGDIIEEYESSTVSGVWTLSDGRFTSRGHNHYPKCKN